MNIAVYCSSKHDLQMPYIDIALKLGHWLGINGHTLVYGGVDAGLMHVVGKACHDSGGSLVGVVPRNFATMADRLLDRVILTDDLSQRKSKLYQVSDLHVVLPGGVGTIDEWMSALSQWVVDKREGVGIVVVNYEGIYDAILAELEYLSHTPFAGQRHLEAMAVVNNASGMLDTLYNLTTL